MEFLKNRDQNGSILESLLISMYKKITCLIKN